jgi:WD40 repeat protein
MKNINHLLSMREISPEIYQPLLREEIYTEALKFFREKPIDISKEKINKIYSSTWISEEIVVFGTKDKKLCWLNTRNKKIYLIKDYRTDEEKVNLELMIKSTGIKSIHYGCNKLAISVNNKVDIYSDKKCDHVFKKEKSININMNWISNVRWADYNKILMSSRDGTIKLYNIDTNENHKIHEYRNHSNDLTNSNYCRHFCHKDNTIYGLSPNGTMKFFDIQKQKKIYDKTNELKECVVSNLNDNLFTIGSNDVVTFFDTRIKEQILEIPNMNGLMGTRSLEWYDDNVLSIGGGKNNLSFYDIRVNRGFIKSETTTKIYNIDKGWIREDDLYQQLEFAYAGEHTETGIYTHCYNQYKNKIFVAGGPTSMGLFGSHITILE